MEITIKQINEILANLENPTSTKGVSLLTTHEPTQKNELNQGEYDSRMKIYTTPIEGVFLKITEEIDSYHSNWRIAEVQFVQPTQKTVTDYEPIK